MYVDAWHASVLFFFVWCVILKVTNLSIQGKKTVVSDVILPPWAANVDDFVRQVSFLSIKYSLYVFTQQ